MVKKIIVCSRSQEKTAEAEEVLKKFGIEVISVENAEIGNLNEIREAAKNIGALVALEVANLTGECCICDDCMLAVNALGGRPGFAANVLTGDRTSDEAMDDILLALKQKAVLPAETKNRRRRCFWAKSAEALRLIGVRKQEATLNGYLCRRDMA